MEGPFGTSVSVCVWVKKILGQNFLGQNFFFVQNFLCQIFFWVKIFLGINQSVNNGTFLDAERARLASTPDAERAILTLTLNENDTIFKEESALEFKPLTLVNSFHNSGLYDSEVLRKRDGVKKKKKRKIFPIKIYTSHSGIIENFLNLERF